jgi:hypothetical protein
MNDRDAERWSDISCCQTASSTFRHTSGNFIHIPYHRPRQSEEHAKSTLLSHASLEDITEGHRGRDILTTSSIWTRSTRYQKQDTAVNPLKPPPRTPKSLPVQQTAQKPARVWQDILIANSPSIEVDVVQKPYTYCAGTEHAAAHADISNV